MSDQDNKGGNSPDDTSGQHGQRPSVTEPLRNGDEDLWLDRLARSLGFGRLAKRISPTLQPSYVYAVTTVVGWNLLSAGANIFVFETELIYATNPYFLLQPVVLIGGVYGAHSLHRSYLQAIDEMQLSERSSDPDTFVHITPGWLPWVLFGTAAGLQLFRTVSGFGEFTTVGLVANGFIFPFVYAPILVQFFVIYLGIEFIAPWRLYRSDVGVHFLDPHGVGGLRPIGELVKKAYYYVVFGLIVYALITYSPGVEGVEVSTTAGTIFTSVWGATILTVAFAVLILHRFLHREKRRELRRLEAQLHEHVEHPWDVRRYNVPDTATEEVADIRKRIEEVSATREYPATFSIWTQLLLSVAIPKALQLFLASI